MTESPAFSATAHRDRRRGWLRRIGVLVLLSGLLGSCAAGPVLDQGPRPSTFAIPAYQETTLGAQVAAAAERQPAGHSGFAVIAEGRSAFAARRRLVEQAERSLDLQYFIWDPDVSGLSMLADLVEAADRGVRIRLLLDDLFMAPTDDALALVDRHRNVEVRFYNPSPDRQRRRMGFLTSFATFNHRMHNKSFIADNALGIIGGRNIGDKYFIVDEQSNFRDLDLLAAGPVVRDISQSFDAFWNSPLSVRLSELMDGPGPVDEAGIGQTLRRRVQALPDAAVRVSWLQRQPAGGDGLPSLKDLIWAPAVVVVDGPRKPLTSRPKLMRDLRRALGPRPRQDLLFEVAYVIPTEPGLDYLCALVAGGARVRGLTNSFASNDLLVTHAGYADYRRALVDCGVELYELRPDADFADREWTWLPSRSDALLHTKAMVVDHRWVFIGSLNFDPRSVVLNTELGVLVDSQALSARLTGFIEDGMSLDNAYRLETRDGRLAWVTHRDGAVQTLTTEPNTTAWDRFLAGLLGILPLDWML